MHILYLREMSVLLSADSTAYCTVKWLPFLVNINYCDQHWHEYFGYSFFLKIFFLAKSFLFFFHGKSPKCLFGHSGHKLLFFSEECFQAFRIILCPCFIGNMLLLTLWLNQKSFFWMWGWCKLLSQYIHGFVLLLISYQLLLLQF